MNFYNRSDNFAVSSKEDLFSACTKVSLKKDNLPSKIMIQQYTKDNVFVVRLSLVVLLTCRSFPQKSPRPSLKIFNWRSAFGYVWHRENEHDNN